MDWVVRFLIGGTIVSVFALIGDVLKPKGFAGLFGAASSVALATLGLTIATQGKVYAAIEVRSMVAGAAAFFLYALGCLYVIGIRHFKPAPATLALLSIWVVSAFALWATLLR
jgi:hypothetical protein